MQGRARPDTIGYFPSYMPVARIAGARNSAATRLNASATRTLAAPARRPRSAICAKSSCWPTSTATACTSKPRSASHRIVTDVSSPPLYARTAFSTIVRLHDVGQGVLDGRRADPLAADDQDRVVAGDRARDLGECRTVDPLGQHVGRTGRRPHDEADVGPNERDRELCEQPEQPGRRRRAGPRLGHDVPQALGVVHPREPELLEVAADRGLGRLVTELCEARPDLLLGAQPLARDELDDRLAPARPRAGGRAHAASSNAAARTFAPSSISSGPIVNGGVHRTTSGAAVDASPPRASNACTTAGAVDPCTRNPHNKPSPRISASAPAGASRATSSRSSAPIAATVPRSTSASAGFTTA